MKIKKFLQNKFKIFFHYLFHFIYGKIDILNNNDDLDVTKYELREITVNGKNYKLDNTIFVLSNARVFTDLTEHVAIIKDNKIIPEISYQQVKGELMDITYNKVLHSGTNRIIKDFEGTVLSLVQGASGNNYFHFLFDIILKLKIFKNKFSLDKIDFFYVPGASKWQKIILSLFDIPEEKLIDSNKYRHIRAKKIIATDHPWYKKGFVQEEINYLPEWSVHFLRDKFLKYKKTLNVSKKIFIDRSDSKFNHCQLINNQEIINYLEAKGFECFQVSKLHFFEQIYLFNNADIIIGPHGAAFTNIIFSKPGMKLIELIPKNHGSIKCEKISKILNFKYKRVTLDVVKSEIPEIKGDIKIDIDELEKIINST